MEALGDEGRCQQIFQKTSQPLAKAEKATFLRGLRSEREKRLVAYEAAYARAAAAHVPKYLATDGLGERARAAREKLAALAKLEFLPQSDADGAGGLRGEVAEAMTTLREAYLLGPEDLASAFPQMAEARTKMQNLLLVTDWVRMAAGLGATVFEEPLADAKFMGAARAAQKAGKTRDRQKNCRCGQEAEYRWIRYGIWHRKMAKPRESCQKKIENIYIVINLFSATYVFKVYAYGLLRSFTSPRSAARLVPSFAVVNGLAAFGVGCGDNDQVLVCVESNV